MESLKILITGVSGFIGSNVAGHLVNANHEIYGISRSKHYNWRLEELRGQIRLITSDICSYENLREAIKSIKPDGIIHCAQYGAYPQEKINKEMFYTNVAGLFNILEICSDLNISWLINCGTSFEYGGSEKKIFEEVKSNPVSYYGIFKSASTNMLSLYSRVLRTKLLTLRIFQAYGPFEPKGRLAAYLLYNLISNLTVYLNSPNIERDFIYVKDVSAMFEKSIKIIDNIERHEIINAGRGIPVSIQDFARTGKEVLGSSSKIILGNIAEKPEDRMTRLVADISKARRILKWSPKYDIKNGIRDYAVWMNAKLNFYIEQR